MAHLNMATRAYGWFAITVVMLFMFSVVVASHWALTGIKNRLTQDVGQSLQTVLTTTHEATRAWLQIRKQDIKNLAQRDSVKALANELLTTPATVQHIAEHPAQLKLRHEMADEMGTFQDLGFFIISPERINIGSMRDSNLGQINLIASYRDKLLSRVFTGETHLIPPVRSDVALPDLKGNLITNYPTMFIAAPIRGDNNNVIAALALRIDPARFFTRIASTGRIGETGETYAFDDDGRLITESRYDVQLRQIGLLPAEGSAIASLKLTDPGVNLLTNPRQLLDQQLDKQRPLTYMARHAIKGQPGLNIEGYRDYRGVTVFGAWLWDDELGIGFTTEIDEEEALHPYFAIRTTTITLLIIYTTLVVMLISLMVYRYQQSQKLIKADLAKRSALEKLLRATMQHTEKLQQQLQAENTYLQEVVRQEHHFEKIIGTSPAIKKVFHQIEKVAPTDTTVLIMGESGTGKELIAHAIHSLSNRNQRPLVKINSAALPSDLLESELFGHLKGSFTGAIADKQGRFELANKGTLFLDEVGELALALQPKLLRVLQEGEFERVGSNDTLKGDVRLIAATNVQLQQAVEKGDFREDLYYRLNVFPIMLPPLRQRREDIPLLVNHFVNQFAEAQGKKINQIAPHVMERLIQYQWPGNIRELQNVIERAVILSPAQTLVLPEMTAASPGTASSEIVPDSDQPLMSLKAMEKQHILKVLKSTGWKIEGEAGAAQQLDINPATLRGRMRKLEIVRPAKKTGASKSH